MRALATWFSNLPLARKLSWLAMGAVALAVTAYGLAVFSVEVVNNHLQAHQRFTTLADVVALNSTAALAFQNAADARDVLNALRQDANVQAAWILKPDRTVFAEYQRNPTNPRPLSPSQSAETGRKLLSSNLVLERPIVVSNETLGTVVVDCSRVDSWINVTEGWGPLGLG